MIDTTAGIILRSELHFYDACDGKSVPSAARQDGFVPRTSAPSVCGVFRGTVLEAFVSRTRKWSNIIEKPR